MSYVIMSLYLNVNISVCVVHLLFSILYKLKFNIFDTDVSIIR